MAGRCGTAWLLAASVGFLAAGCGREKPAAVRGISEPAAAVAMVPQTAAPMVVPRYHALVIGISDYSKHGAEGWDRLVTPRKDAEAMADVLSKKYGFDVTSLLDGEATRANIIEALDDLVNLTPDDAVLIYFAGHGSYDESIGEGYWIPVDGKKTDGKHSGKADWIWNSMITKIISASQARHVLVVADSCYGGSLFRGGATPVLDEDFQWYARAIRAPSRYLITSGDLEPVMDSGGRHSVFAQELLNFLEHTDHPVFSASDIGFALREKVSTLTGQLVRMGPLSTSAHAGGEFVFVAKGTQVEWPEPGQQLVASTAQRGAQAAKAGEAVPAASKVDELQDALLLKSQGATKNADHIASGLLAQNANDQVVQAVAAFVQGNNRAKDRDALRDLIDQLEKRKAAQAQSATADDGIARPRVLACFGPTSRDNTADGEALALLTRICLSARIATHGTFRLVEREAIENLLTELNLGASPLSDKEAGLELGRLLPASLIVLGDLIPSGKGYDLYLRLVDTETTRILGSFTGHAESRDGLPDLCAKLADDVMFKAQLEKPLTARVLQDRNGVLEAGLGNFHGIDTGMTFALVERADTDGGLKASPAEKNVGTAHAVAIGDLQSDFAPAWTDAAAKRSGSLWLEESAAPAP